MLQVDNEMPGVLHVYTRMQNMPCFFRVFKTDIPGSDSSFRLSTFSTDFSTINMDFPRSRLKGQVFHI